MRIAVICDRVVRSGEPESLGGVAVFPGVSSFLQCHNKDSQSTIVYLRQIKAQSGTFSKWKCLSNKELSVPHG